MSRNNLKDKESFFSIKEYCSKLPEKSGVYQMFDKKNRCLYVGKAKNLRNRVANYVNTKRLTPRIQTMVAATTKMQHIVTPSEPEALLLEANLIKSLAPKFNILLRDDKSFPYIEITNHPQFPRLTRVKTKDLTRPTLFGPFSSSQTADELVAIMQKTFKLRVCSDAILSNRASPCVYYQINRCSAPCVQKVTLQQYKENVNQATKFLHGNTKQLCDSLTQCMHQMSEQNNFEKALECRDRLRMLSGLNLNFSVILPTNINADSVTITQEFNMVCIQVIVFRQGKSVGMFHYFLEQANEENLGNVMEKFLIQFYKKRELPEIIYCNHLPQTVKTVTDALYLLTTKKVSIKAFPHKLHHISDFSKTNLQMAINRHINVDVSWQTALQNLEKILNISLKRIEVYDNSHLYGKNMLGVMVVAKEHGFDKSQYRSFNLKNPKVSGFDDYSTMREVLTRRLTPLTTDSNLERPDLLIIDGGGNHLQIAHQVLQNLNLHQSIRAISIAKDSHRTVGREKVLLSAKTELDLTNEKAVFLFLLKLRDEAHRFAITTQRKRSLKGSTTSILDDIPGVGEITKQKLLLHFKSPKAIAESSAEHIHATTKIGIKLAQKILEWL